MQDRGFERLRKQKLAEEKRAQTEAQSDADRGIRQQNKADAYWNEVEADRQIARRVIEESGLGYKVREYCQLTGIEYRAPVDEGPVYYGPDTEAPRGSERFKQTLYEVILSRRKTDYPNKERVTKIQIAARPNGDIEVRGGAFRFNNYP